MGFMQIVLRRRLISVTVRSTKLHNINSNWTAFLNIVDWRSIKQISDLHLSVEWQKERIFALKCTFREFVAFWTLIF